MSNVGRHEKGIVISDEFRVGQSKEQHVSEALADDTSSPISVVSMLENLPGGVRRQMNLYFPTLRSTNPAVT